MGHRGQVHYIILVVDLFTQGNRQAHLVVDELLARQQGAHRYDLLIGIGHLDTDGAFTREWAQ